MVPEQTPPRPSGLNPMALLGFVFAFFFPFAGLILSFVALGQCAKTGQRGRGLALAGVIFSAIGIVFWLLAAVMIVMWVFPFFGIALRQSKWYQDYISQAMAIAGHLIGYI
ncbi:MAG: DUF4190 domain-containing protein [Oscillospiraceae bacterium]|jgi:uncharacterized protein with PQ loop repeat|nr:DUF4190 domain-containing protein [Oscillospiraceae bacterium]